jgi:hypothetical protein
MDFERKFQFFQNYENYYTGQLCITDPQCGDHDQKILNFSQFMPQTEDFR